MGGGGGGQSGCERRSEVFVKHLGWGSGRSGSGGGGRVGCGVRVDVNEEMKFFVKNGSLKLTLTKQRF